MAALHAPLLVVAGCVVIVGVYHMQGNAIPRGMKTGASTTRTMGWR